MEPWDMPRPLEQSHRDDKAPPDAHCSNRQVWEEGFKNQGMAFSKVSQQFTVLCGP